MGYYRALIAFPIRLRVAVVARVSSPHARGGGREYLARMEPKLVIELDGGQHAERTAQDAERAAFLEGLGYRVMRYWNHEGLRSTQAVLEDLRVAVIDGSPHPGPPWVRGRSRRRGR